jgi:hypothetical protein
MVTVIEECYYKPREHCKDQTGFEKRSIAKRKENF